MHRKKTKKIKNRQVPYMNSELRKAINVRNMLKRKYFNLSLMEPGIIINSKEI